MDTVLDLEPVILNKGGPTPVLLQLEVYEEKQMFYKKPQ